MPWQVTARVTEGLAFLNNQPMKKEECMRLGQQLCTAAIAIHRHEQKVKAEQAAQRREPEVLFDTVPVFPPEGDDTEHFEVPQAPPAQSQQNRSPQAPEGTGAQAFG